MLADRLRQRVTIEKPRTEEAGADTFGTIDLTLDANWLYVADRYAEVVPLNGRETDTDAQQRADLTHRVTFRFDRCTTQIQPTWRIRYTDIYQNVRKLNVVSSFDKEEKHEEIVCRCTEAR